MKKLKQSIFSLLLISPLTALASGQEILVVAAFELFLIIILLVVLWLLNLTIGGKLLLFSIYLLSTYLAFHFINTGGYFENFSGDAWAVIVSVIIVCAAYFILKNKFKKQ